MSEKPIFTRQRIISSVLALIILALSLYFFGVFKSSKKQPLQKSKDSITNVISAPVSLKNTAVTVQSNGVLVAKNKIDIVSRTQGIFERGDRSFRSGVNFNEGDVMIQIDNTEFIANLRASRAQLLQSLTTILADLKFDYTDSFEKWNRYTQNFDVNNRLKELPKTSSDREKAFINSKNIVTQYYNIKAQEVKSSYYKIRAPFSGTLRENLVDKGAMINAGQKLGTLIDPSRYELEVKINPSELNLIKVGKSVVLTNGDKTENWTGKVSRINKVIDTQSQSVLVIIEVSGENLREGMFLQTEISTEELNNVAEISRALLFEERFVYLIQDSTLVKKEIEVSHISDKTVFVKGLEDGVLALQKNVPGAYDGMKVNPISISE